MERTETLEMGEGFTECPKCSYQRGFHSIFKKEVDNGAFKWVLICPNCGVKFDLGLTISLKA